MRLAYPVSALLLFTVHAPAGEVQGHAIITRRLTKKALSPIVYNLRGTAAPVAPSPAPAHEAEPVNEFERMVVILEPKGKTHAQFAAKPPVTSVLDQNGVRFSPDFIVVPVGSTVQFPNSDPIFHNVFSLSKAQSFDLGYYPQGQSRSVKFNTPGVVQVYCHIHASMYAAIVVTASPWYENPASDGGFSFSNVPPGHYQLTAWHKVAGLFKRDVEVPENGSVEADIRVPLDMEP